MKFFWNWQKSWCWILRGFGEGKHYFWEYLHWNLSYYVIVLPWHVACTKRTILKAFNNFEKNSWYSFFRINPCIHFIPPEMSPYSATMPVCSHSLLYWIHLPYAIHGQPKRDKGGVPSHPVLLSQAPLLCLPCFYSERHGKYTNICPMNNMQKRRVCEACEVASNWQMISPGLHAQWEVSKIGKSLVKKMSQTIYYPSVKINQTRKHQKYHSGEQKNSRQPIIVAIDHLQQTWTYFSCKRGNTEKGRHNKKSTINNH